MLQVDLDHLMNNWPVTSSHTGLAYKNAACGGCRENDNNMTSAGLRAECQSPLPNQTESDVPESYLEQLAERPDCSIQV